LRLVSRMGNIYRSFPGLGSAVADCLRVRDAVLDKEIVHLDAPRRPQFMPLLRRRSPQHFVAFEVLWLNGKDLARMPLVERKRILRSIVPVEAPVMYANHIHSAGRELYQAVCDMDLEGIVAQRKDGLYTRSDDLGEDQKPGVQSRRRAAGVV
jgi:bifunctional non-homologous end joining protein LigD